MMRCAYIEVTISLVEVTKGLSQAVAQTAAALRIDVKSNERSLL